MSDSDDIRHGRNCVFNLQVHLVFVTKYRRKVFTDGILSDMESIVRETCATMGCELVEFNGETDHVHLLVSYPPKIPVSKLVNMLKGVSSRQLRKKYTLHTHRGHLWSPSYYAASNGGAALKTLKKYIQNQKRPD